MKLTDFKVVYICPEHNEKYRLRKQHMEELLRKIGFKNIIHYTSGTDNYPTCLVKATIEILHTYLNEPIILLEDDVEWTGIIDIEYNPGADAIYLGISRNAGHPTQNMHHGPSQFVNWSNDTVKVINMLSAHAILYISPEYKRAVIDILKWNSNTNYYNDILISRIQQQYTVLAHKSPIFYQSSKFNDSDVEFQTRFEITL
jgi:hypothetical protein